MKWGGVVFKEMGSSDHFLDNIALFEAPRPSWHVATLAHTNTQGSGTLLIYVFWHGRQCDLYLFLISDTCDNLPTHLRTSSILKFKQALGEHIKRPSQKSRSVEKFLSGTFFYFVWDFCPGMATTHNCARCASRHSFSPQLTPPHRSWGVLVHCVYLVWCDLTEN